MLNGLRTAFAVGFGLRRGIQRVHASTAMASACSPTSSGRGGHARWCSRSRAMVLKELKETLPRAADTLTDLMSDWGLFGLLTDERLGPGFGVQERIFLGNLLQEIRRRCHQASWFPELVSPDGKPKAGRNKLLALGQIDEKVVCASTVAAAWKFIAGKVAWSAS